MKKKLNEFWELIHSIDGKYLLRIHNVVFLLIWLYVVGRTTIESFMNSFLISLIISPMMLIMFVLIYLNFRLYPFAIAWLSTFRAFQNVYNYQPGVLNYIKFGLNRTKHAYRNTNLDLRHYIDVFGVERVERRGKQGKRSNAIMVFGEHFFLIPILRAFFDFIFIWPLSFIIGPFAIYRLKRKGLF